MRVAVSVLTLAALLGGCQANQAMVERQTAALSLTSDSLAQRQVQMRRFDSRDETALLAAGAAVMQDLGFTIEEAEKGAGLIVGAKDRDAVEAGQVAGQVFFAALITAMGGRANPVWDQTQKIRLSLTARPSADRSGTMMRVTFQRVVWNNRSQVSKLETIDDPVIYQQFFDRLSQAVFLEAHHI